MKLSFKKTTKPKKNVAINNSGVNTPESNQSKNKLYPVNTGQDQFSRGVTSVKDIIAPSAIEVDFSHQKIDNTFFRTLFVSGYPRFVNANWLAPLINFHHSLNISMYIYPIDGRGIMSDLRRKVGEMEAEIQSDVERGRIADVSTKVKLEDAKSLQIELAKGSERFFQFGLYITIPANSLDELNKVTKQVQSALGSLMIIAKPASLQMNEAFKTTLPLAQDRLMITRNMDTTSLATTFPFTSSELTQNTGVLYGINQHNSSLIILDRFTLENANAVVFAKSGAGKSISGHEPVLYNNGSGPQISPIGTLVDQLMVQKGSQKIDHEMEGVINPNLKVFTFDKNLKGGWSNVTVAARKKAPKKLYQFTTSSGRQITTTADHNLITLKEGQVTVTRGDKLKVGDHTPIPRQLKTTNNNPTNINLLRLLNRSPKVYVHFANQFIKSHYQVIKSKDINPKYDHYLYRYAQKRPIPIKYFTQILKKTKLKPTKSELNQIRLGSRVYQLKTSLAIKLKFSPALSKLIGYYLSEGGSTKNFIHITQLDKSIRKDIKSCLEKLNWAYFTTPSAIRLGSRITVELFKLLKLGVSAQTKSAPTQLYQQPLKLIGLSLKTYFEGDGTVDSHQVSAISKSKQLISSLSYLLLYFGIIVRIKKVFKRATNSNHAGSYYYQLTVSGQQNLKKFSKQIGFVSLRKNKKLNNILKKTINTNVDVIPQTQLILKSIYQALYSSSGVKSPPNLSPLKENTFNPSRQTLKKLIKTFEQKIDSIELMPSNGFASIEKLPSINSLTQRISQNKKLNSIAWQELGESWRLIKTKQVSPGANNIFRLLKTIDGYDYPLPIVKQEIYHAFSTLGESLKKFDSSLWASVTQRVSGDTTYQRLFNAKKYLKKTHQQKLIKIQQVKKQIKQLKKLASSELFWDPITSIKIHTNHKQKYVYDLTVDNEVFVSGFGGLFIHNSYLVKLEALRSLMFDTEVVIIDPENEYQKLCESVGGQYIQFSFKSTSKINPFDLSQVYEEGQNELSQKVLSLHSLFKIIMGDLSPQEEALLDRSIILTYKQKGITPDPATQKKEPPLLEDLYKVLIGMEEPAALNLAARIEKFVKGSFRGIFDQHTNVDIKNTFTVFSIQELEDALRPIAMFMILDHIWTKVKRDLKKRLLVVDEAWYMMKYPDSASFLYSMAKRARKYYLGLTTITQDVEDFLSSDYGKAIVTNSSIQILMKQSPAAIDKLAKTFYLSEGEKHLLLGAGIGHGIIFAGQNHVAVKVVASPDEHVLITSDPKEVLANRNKEDLAKGAVPNFQQPAASAKGSLKPKDSNLAPPPAAVPNFQRPAASAKGSLKPKDSNPAPSPA